MKQDEDILEHLYFPHQMKTSDIRFPTLTALLWNRQFGRKRQEVYAKNHPPLPHQEKTQFLIASAESDSYGVGVGVGVPHFESTERILF